jgi:hypothetical protein
MPKDCPRPSPSVTFFKLFPVENLLASAQSRSWMTTPCRMSGTVYRAGGHSQAEDAPCHGDKGPNSVVVIT